LTSYFGKWHVRECLIRRRLLKVLVQRRDHQTVIMSSYLVFNTDSVELGDITSLMREVRFRLDHGRDTELPLLSHQGKGGSASLGERTTRQTTPFSLTPASEACIYDEFWAMIYIGCFYQTQLVMSAVSIDTPPRKGICTRDLRIRERNVILSYLILFCQILIQSKLIRSNQANSTP
jgi:hypothetical protein